KQDPRKTSDAGEAESSKVLDLKPPNREAAQVLLTRVTKWSWVKAWAMNVAKRRGRQRAIVALARRLAVIMHRMWSDGTRFRWTKESTPVAV
ncbi:hypothetical protein NKI56_26275, partial [Mesorhizobium sp. M0622]